MGGLGFPEIVILIVPFAFAAFLIWMVARKIWGGEKQHLDVQKEIVSKFSSGDELRDFLKSEEGKALFRNFATDVPARRSPRERAVSRIGIGIVLMIVGGGLLILAHYADQSEDSFISSAVQPPPPGISGATRGNDRHAVGRML